MPNQYGCIYRSILINIEVYTFALKTKNNEQKFMQKHSEKRLNFLSGVKSTTRKHSFLHHISLENEESIANIIDFIS